MPITSAQRIDRTFYRLTQGKPMSATGIYRTAIEATESDALQRLGQRVADSSDPSRLQKLFSLTLSSGEVAISATMVASSIPAAKVTLSGTTENLEYRPYIQDLDNMNMPVWSDFVFFTKHENKIKVRDNLGAVPSATALSVYCNYIPAISEVPDELIDDLIDISCEIVLETMSLAEVEAEAHA